MIEVETPFGQVFTFPDGTPDDVMDQQIRASLQLPQRKPKKTFDTSKSMSQLIDEGKITSGKDMEAYQIQRGQEQGLPGSVIADSLGKKLTPEQQLERDVYWKTKGLQDSIAPNIRIGMGQAGADVLSLASRLTGIGDADALNVEAQQWDAAANQLSQGDAIPDILQRGVRGASRTLPMMVATSMTPAGPYGAIGYATTTSWNQALTEGKQRGLEGAELQTYAATKGAIEGIVTSVMQRVGLGGLEGGLTKKGMEQIAKEGARQWVKTTASQYGQELAEEQIISTANRIVDRVAIGDEDSKLTWDKFFSDFAENAVGVGVNMAAMRTGARAVAPIAQRAGLLGEQQPAPTPQDTQAIQPPQQAQQPSADDPATFLRNNPAALESVLNLPESPSRTQFAKATGIPRQQAQREVINSYVQAARQVRQEQQFQQSMEEGLAPPVEDDFQASPPIQQPAPQPDLVGSVDQMQPGQRGQLFSTPQAQQAFRDQLSEMSASEIAEQFGYKKGKWRKKELMDKVMERYMPKEQPAPTPRPAPRPTPTPAPVPQATQPQLQQQKPAPAKPATPKPKPPQETAPKPQVTTPPPQPTTTPEQKSETPAEMPDQVKSVYDSLPEDLDGLISFADAVGFKVPKKGTRARKELKAEDLRRQIAESMTTRPKDAKVIDFSQEKQSPLTQALAGVEKQAPRTAQEISATDPDPEVQQEEAPAKAGRKRMGGPSETPPLAGRIKKKPKPQEERFTLSSDPVKEQQPYLPDPGKQKQTSFISGIGKDLPGQQTFIDTDGTGNVSSVTKDAGRIEDALVDAQDGPVPTKLAPIDDNPRDTSDQAVENALNTLRKSGRKAAIVEPTSDLHQDIANFVGSFGLRAVFAKMPKNTNGFSHKGVVVIRHDIDGADSMWDTAGHEIAHGTKIDTLRGVFDEELVMQKAREYYEKTSAQYRKRLDANPDMLYREGVASIIGEFMRDSKFRTRLMNESPSAWVWIVNKISDILATFSPRSKQMQSAAKVLKHHMAKEQFKRQFVRAEAKKFAQKFNELNDSKLTDDDLRQFESDYIKLADEIQSERMQRWSDIEDAKRRVKRQIGWNAKKLRDHENSGKDYSTVPRLDEWAQALASETGGLHGVFSGRGEQGPDYAAEFWPYLRENQERQAPSLLDESLHVVVANELAAGRVPIAGEVVVKPTEDPKFNSDLKLAKDLLAQDNDDSSMFRQIAELVAEDNKDSGFGSSDPNSDEVIVDAYRKLAQMMQEPDPEDTPFQEVAPEDEKPVQDTIMERIAAIPGAKDLAKRLQAEGKLPTLDEVETQRAFGRANPATTQAGREQLFRQDLEQGAPEYRPRSVSESIAKKRMKKDGAGKVLQSFLDRFSIAAGEPMNEADTVLVRDLLNQTSVASALQLGDKATNDLATLNRGYRTSRTEEARALSLRDPMINKPEVRNNRAIIDAITPMSPEDRKKFVDNAKENGVDLTDKNTYKDDDKIIRALGIARTMQGSVMDMIYEYYLNSILSGPQTHIANFVGNTANILWFNTVERAGEIAVSKMTNGKLSDDGMERDFQELKLLYKGMGGSIMRALSNSVKAWKHEYSPLNLMLNAQSEMKFKEGTGGSIPGETGRVVRLSFRFLQAADEFARTISSHGAVALHAYRIAKKEGITDPELMSRRIEQLTSDYSSVAWQFALAEANYQAFQQKGGGTARGLKQTANFAKTVPFLGQAVKYTFPFSTFMVNSFERAADLTPGLGAIVAVMNHYSHVTAEGYRSDKSRDQMNRIQRFLFDYHKDDVDAVNWNRTIGNQITGLAIVGLIASMISGGEDEDGLPMITGTRERSLSARGTQYRTAPPTSIRVGDKWYSYNRIEPFASPISLIVDYLNSSKTDVAAFERVMESISKQALDKNYLQGFQDLSSITDREYGWRDLPGNVAVGFVPNIAKQPVREARNIVTDSRIRKGDSWSQVAKKLMIKAELPVTGFTYRYDIWGRKIQPNAPQTSLPYRLLSPAKRKDKADVLPVDVAIHRWNELHAKDEDKQYNPSTPNPPKMPSGQPHVTMQEYETYSREYGEISYRMVKDVKFSDPPTEQQIEYIKSARRKAQGIARQRILQRRQGITPPSY